MINDNSSNSTLFATNLEWVYEHRWTELEEWYFNRPSLSYLSDWGIQYIEKYNHYLKHKKTTPYLNSNKLYFKKTKPHTRGRIMKRIKK